MVVAIFHFDVSTQILIGTYVRPHTQVEVLSSLIFQLIQLTMEQNTKDTKYNAEQLGPVQHLKSDF